MNSLNEFLKVKKEDLKGKVIVFPTDTVYGIGTGWLDLEGIEKIYELKKRDIKNVKVLYSLEKAKDGVLYDEMRGTAIPGSIAYVPSVAGLMIASHIINSIIK